MAKIAWLDQRCLFDPVVFAAVAEHGGHDWCNFRKTLAMETTLRAMYVRAGRNNLPFASTLQAPNYDDNWCEIYSDITDRRCVDLLRDLDDAPWCVAWSGGIDSTTIMVSIMRNMPSQLWRRGTVAMNSMSVYENPGFYQEMIQPNFQVKMVSDLAQVKDLCVITGHPNDQLFEGAFQPFALRYRTWGLRDIHRDPDDLLAILAQLVDPAWARWFYESMIENILSTGLSIRTYSQFWWWWFFNHMWNSVVENRHGHVAWFDTPAYQQWSLHHNLDHCHDGSHHSYKQAAKAYITTVWKNHYYHTYKTKYHSGSLASSLKNHRVLAQQQHTVEAKLDDGSYFSSAVNDDVLGMILDHVQAKM